MPRKRNIVAGIVALFGMVLILNVTFKIDRFFDLKFCHWRSLISFHFSGTEFCSDRYVSQNLYGLFLMCAGLWYLFLSNYQKGFEYYQAQSEEELSERTFLQKRYPLLYTFSKVTHLFSKK
jgi:hypothetical protein